MFLFDFAIVIKTDGSVILPKVWQCRKGKCSCFRMIVVTTTTTMIIMN